MTSIREPAGAATVAMGGEGLPVTIIRGGTSRGVYLREADVPADVDRRTALVLRLFGGGAAMLADGLGGEHPVLRKVAIVGPAEPAPDGTPRVRYTFGQVDAELRRVEYSQECGNLAAGVPLFSVLQGWAPRADPSARLSIELVNTGKTLVAEWLDARDTAEGRVRLSFVAPAADRSCALPLGDPRTRTGVRGRLVSYSAVSATNDYVFVEGSQLGIADPCGVRQLDGDVYDVLLAVMDEHRERCGRTPKVCIVARAASAAAVSALVVYPAERRLHASFPVTGAVTLAVAACLEGTVPHDVAGLGAGSRLDVVHPAGTLSVFLHRGSAEVPERAGIERAFRLLMRGTAY